MKTITISSNDQIRWRAIGLEAWNQISAGSTESISIDDGFAIEISSIVDNATIKISGQVAEINILASKLTNLVASFSSMRSLKTLEVNSESEVIDEERMLNKVRITEDLLLKFTSTNNNNRYYFSDLSEIDRVLIHNEKDSYSRFNLLTLDSNSSLPIFDNVNEFNGDSLDLRAADKVESLSGSPIKALDKFGVVMNDGRALPYKYDVVFDYTPLPEKTLELDLSVKSNGESVYVDEIEDDASFDYVPLVNKTLELDLGVKSNGESVYRDEIGSEASLDYVPLADKTLELDLGVKSNGESVYRDEVDDGSVFNDSFDSINYTLEIDLYSQGALTDVDGNAYSSTNRMDLTQLPL